ncbi:MAG TPA: hypothetical protein VGP16_28735 [Asanoa sp.]|nr:hypothetical protein [Asanoa sp.]
MIDPAVTAAASDPDANACWPSTRAPRIEASSAYAGQSVTVAAAPRSAALSAVTLRSTALRAEQSAPPTASRVAYPRRPSLVVATVTVRPASTMVAASAAKSR